MKNKITKLFILNFSIAIINILAFSKAFFGISVYEDSILIVTCSIFIPIMSIIIFLYGNWSILNQEKARGLNIEMDALKDSRDYEDILEKNAKKIPFLSNEFEQLREQIKRMDQKEEALLEYLKQNNREDQFLKAEAENARAFMLQNVRRVLSKCIIIVALDKDNDKDSRNVYLEQKEEISSVIRNNEKTLDEFDIFLEEVSKMGEKPLEENISLQSTIKAMRQIRGADTMHISFERRF